MSRRRGGRFNGGKVRGDSRRSTVIQAVSGDILLSRAAVIAHGVSPNDDFHQGLARSLREKWPAMYKDFRHYSKTYSPRAGGLWVWKGADGQRIVSLFTQDPAPAQGGRRARASLQHVGHALKALHQLAVQEKWSSIALPRVGTGVGGLDWKDVEPLIRQHLDGIEARVIVYTGYHAGVAASEKLQ
jgi:O-acetyl-ADP-ribose deacetylase (regulator of RNase III)